MGSTSEIVPKTRSEQQFSIEKISAPSEHGFVRRQTTMIKKQLWAVANVEQMNYSVCHLYCLDSLLQQPNNTSA
jgi:hypothetical protein